MTQSWNRGSRRAGFAWIAVAAMLSAATALSGSAGAAVETGWSATDHDGARSRYNATDTTIGSANVAKLAARRSFKATSFDNVCGNSGFVTSPVLTGGLLYAVRTQVSGGTTEAVLTAWNAGTGAVKFSRVLETDPSDAYPDIAVVGGRVFLQVADCASQSDPPGEVEAFDAATGTPLWTYADGYTYDSLVVSGGRVVTSGSSPGSGLSVAALDVASGDAAWVHHLDDCQNGPLLVVHGLALYQTCDESTGTTLTAASVANGTTAWTKKGRYEPERGDASGTAGTHLYAGQSSGTVADINPATGLNRFPLTGATFVLAVDGTQVYADCAAGLCAYTKSTGALAWSRSGSPSELAVANGLLYLDSGAVLSASTGAVLKTLWTSGPARAVVEGEGRVAATINATTVQTYGLN